MAERTVSVLRRKPLGLLAALVLAAACTADSPVPPGQASPEVVRSKVALIDFRPVLGELEANVEALTSLVGEAFGAGARIVVAPELATTGYAVQAEQVAGGLGLKMPFPELAPLGELAAEAGGYLVLGIAEVGEDEVLYNSAAVFGPQGLIGVQRKRSVPTWSAVGNLPFGVVETPWGDFTPVICADTYRSDWVRIATLAGADVVVVPANWWGESAQVSLWQTRAQENGVWVVVANRWGAEDNPIFDPPLQVMNDAPTAVVSPDGEVRLVYRPNENPEPLRDRILYYELEVPRSRVGTATNPTYSVAHRRPGAYPALANPYYVRGEGNEPAPGLPPAGPVRTAAVSYVPAASAERNLETVRRLLGPEARDLDVVVLPGLGVTGEPVACDDPLWASEAPWAQLRSYVDSNGVALLVTTAYTVCPRRLALVLFQAGRPPVLVPQVHDAWGMPGSGEPPLWLDLARTRVGIVTGTDFLFPETAAHLAKSGVDLVVVPSVVTAPEPPGPGAGPVGWDAGDLLRTWKTQTHHCLDVAASDAGGHGIVVRHRGCYSHGALEVAVADSENPVRILTLDNSQKRVKLLNSYHRFDLEALLGP